MIVLVLDLKSTIDFLKLIQSIYKISLQQIYVSLTCM
jgi:hypothetical protein